MASKQAGSLLSSRRGSDTTWHGTAFVVESLVLLVFLAFALAVFMQLFSSAHARGTDERALTQAVTLASNNAEEFAASPQTGSMTETFSSDGTVLASGNDEDAAYVVTREIVNERTSSGTLYRATIAVESNGTTIYTLDTARYVADADSKGGDAA